MSANCVFGPSGQFLDIFGHFFGIFSDILSAFRSSGLSNDLPFTNLNFVCLSFLFPTSPPHPASGNCLPQHPPHPAPSQLLCFVEEKERPPSGPRLLWTGPEGLPHRKMKWPAVVVTIELGMLTFELCMLTFELCRW